VVKLREGGAIKLERIGDALGAAVGFSARWHGKNVCRMVTQINPIYMETPRAKNFRSWDIVVESFERATVLRVEFAFTTVCGETDAFHKILERIIFYARVYAKDEGRQAESQAAQGECNQLKFCRCLSAVPPMR
jgi:hypothetical protein